MDASDKMLIGRKEAERMLHLSRNASYKTLSRSRFQGRVRMLDVRRALAAAARNGAQWGGGELVMLDGARFGISQRALFRALKHAPHFRMTRKVALVEADRVEEFLKRK